MLKYDEDRLVSELSRLSRVRGAAFAAACAERLMPAYVRFSELTAEGDATALRSVLTRVWDEIEDPLIERSPDLGVLLETCMALIPEEDEGPWVHEQAAAEDAGAAVAYALRCLISGEAQEAAWAARRINDALDYTVISREGIDTNLPGGEERIVSNPLVQAELLRQQRDLDELMDAPGGDDASTVRKIRDRASRDAPILLG